MTRPYRQWKPEEDAHVRALWQRNDLTLDEIGEVIDRTGQAVKDRGHRHLGLGSRPLHEPWRPGLFDEVAALYARGEGPSAIAKRFGLSRNQVTSKLDRKGLLKRKPPAPPKGSKPKKATKEKPPQTLRAPPVPRAPHQNNGISFRNKESAATAVEGRAPAAPAPVRYVDEQPGTATVLTLGAHMCRWPIGDPAMADFTFCGRRSVSTYCAEHAQVAYQPASQGKRKSSASELARSLRRYI